MFEARDITEDDFLGGRLRLLQPRRGHRAGHDALLLAASVAAHPNDAVIDLGAGVGAAGFSVAARVPGIALTLVEIDPDICGLAFENAARNRINARVVNANVTDRASLDAAAVVSSSAAAVLMNPPFNDARHHQASPDEARREAHMACAATLKSWMSVALRLLKPRGTLTLIWRADGLSDVLEALRGSFGGIIVQPVHAKPEKPAVRILVRAVKASRAPLSILPGLVLDGTDAVVQSALAGQGRLLLAAGEESGAARVPVTATPSRSDA